MNQLRSHHSLVRKLQDALGDQLCVALDDSSVVEIMLNPDGKLFIERLGDGTTAAGEMSAAAAEMLISTVAHALQSEVDTDQPITSGNCPLGDIGSKVCFLAKPVFKIGRRASRLILLDDYVCAGIMTELQARTIRIAIGSPEHHHFRWDRIGQDDARQRSHRRDRQIAPLRIAWSFSKTRRKSSTPPKMRFYFTLPMGWT